MTKTFLVDTTLCIGCRACQVACKQWHGLPAETTVNRGTYQNPDDLSFYTYKLVLMKETMINGRMRWLFFPMQCRHCLEPPCLYSAGDSAAIYQDSDTGAVIFTALTRDLNDPEGIIGSCPYNIPRKSNDRTLAKCDMCIDRVQSGLLPACVQTCPTGAMRFGDRETILMLARDRLAVVKTKNPDAMLTDPAEVRVIYLTAFAPKQYGEFSIAKNGAFGMTRKMALNRMRKWGQFFNLPAA